MKFLADEGVDSSIVTGLRDLNFDVFYVIEEVRSLDDEALLDIALKDERILITRDKDFGELVFRLHKAHSGVILIRLEGHTTEERGEIVCHMIQQYADQLPNAFTVIQKAIVRIRRQDLLS
jgi:predicted nuclease of predicted toxin-antitoxin system